MDDWDDEMLIEADFVASPFTAGPEGAQQLVIKRQQLAVALARTLKKRLAHSITSSTILENLLPVLGEGGKFNDYAMAWGPEIPRLISFAAEDDASRLPLLDMEVFVLRATGGLDIAGKFSQSESFGLGTLHGVPCRELAGAEFLRTDRGLVVGGVCRPFSTLPAATFAGTADEFGAHVDAGSGTSIMLHAGTSMSCQAAIGEAQKVLTNAGVPLAWIGSAITTLYVTNSETPSSRSGSWDRHFGLSYFSYRTDPYSIADVLLHEACHQNFYLANLDNALAEDDGVLRISPAVNKGRPIWALLLAFHAFANVVIFFSRLRSVDPALRWRYAKRNVDYARKLLSILKECPARPPLYRSVLDRLEREFAVALRELRA